MKKRLSYFLFTCLISIFANSLAIAEEGKRFYTEEFLFTHSYFEALKEYTDVSSPAYLIYVQIAPIEKDVYYSEEEVLNSTFMKTLRTEQEFIGAVIRSMKKYTNAPNPAIKSSAQMILRHYEKRRGINTQAQDSYFHTKLRRFKAGLLTSSELADEKSDLESNLEMHLVIHDVLLPDNGFGLSVTREERDQLIKQLSILKAREDWANLHLQMIDDLLSKKIACSEL